MDYWKDLDVTTYVNWDDFCEKNPQSPNAVPGTTATFCEFNSFVANSSDVMPNSLIHGKT